MPPDDPSESPFASTNPFEAPLEPPEAPELPEEQEPPEAPRLRILHLMVLTACVAGWMGTGRALMLAFERNSPGVASSPYLATSGALYGIGCGAALAGLILLLARRLRGLRFPVHPGEYVLVITAIGVVLQAANYPIRLAIVSIGFSDGRPMWLAVVFLLVTFVVNAAFFAWALVRVKRRRWRIFLLSIPVCYLIGYGLMGIASLIAGPGRLLFVLPGLVPLGAGVVLSVVVIQDHLEGRRYPWSHWMGVSLRLWLDFIRIVWAVWIVLNWGAGF